jgi:ribosomal protein S18 acetylase RimI-like enzyme
MYVAEDSRSSGVGSILLRQAQAEAKARGCAFLELGTPKSGERQIAFYEKHGFTTVGERLRCRLDG